jgi:hypothetical protein
LPSADARRPPLDGIRVLDLTRVVAGGRTHRSCTRRPACSSSTGTPRFSTIHVFSSRAAIEANVDAAVGVTGPAPRPGADAGAVLADWLGSDGPGAEPGGDRAS